MHRHLNQLGKSGTPVFHIARHDKRMARSGRLPLFPPDSVVEVSELGCLPMNRCMIRQRDYYRRSACADIAGWSRMPEPIHSLTSLEPDATGCAPDVREMPRFPP